ncbi:EthD family reductase [Chitinasiproducens palmae]|uniref:Ethyl tert-butyl ether degradation EthD n=1 Tax=Chitinasiproducens palmae TaxID=1770053 RepID=A0A1H2PKM4_9BURK|nr:EthD family reductase [Chitinasiproducens palmae]SDV46974.1 conserved hypothetical protein [Chitinasiproducens palmae]
MQLCLFTAAADGGVPAPDVPTLRQAAVDGTGLQQIIVHRAIASATGLDPRISEKSDAPAWVVQWYFDALDALEHAARDGGPIQRALASSLPAPHHAALSTYQVMGVRRYTLAAPAPARDASSRCSYLVTYEGPAQDPHAWLSHYLAHHPPLMRELPGLRELEIYTRVDSATSLPFTRSDAMQRNKVVFDDPAALAVALASPIRDAMRRDFNALPPFAGGTPHCAMHSTYCNLLAQ